MREVIQKSADFQAKKGVESSRLQTELVLAHVLKLPRMMLYLKFERTLAETELEVMREPLQHLAGSTSLYFTDLK